MMGFLRSLFGFEDETATRQVVGAPVGFGLQEVEYIKNSNHRLSLLQELAARYAATPQGAKMKLAYEKTKAIHSFLVNKKKLHDLEMFHLQNTDHFLTTFTIILDAYQEHRPSFGSQSTAMPAKPADEPKPKPVRVAKQLDLPDMIKPLTSQGQVSHGLGARAPVPRLYVPDISLNTFERITFLHENQEGKLTAHHVGFTSSAAEKEIFVQHVYSRIGIEVSYVGNAHLTIPNNNGVTPTGVVPVVHWEGFLYALNLNDYRLFPVRIYRK